MAQKHSPAEAGRPTGLELLRMPFPEHHISKLPKPTKRQTEEVKADFRKGIRCQVCGTWHHPDVVHLDYVGHAALTDRLLEADPEWSWEPLAFDDQGLPAIDRDGGLWIKLTVCGVTRLGYGDAQGKTGGDAMKERIGDALRNAAMRFGAALDLWHKGGDLHPEAEEAPEAEAPTKRSRKAPANAPQGAAAAQDPDALLEHYQSRLVDCENLATLAAVFKTALAALKKAGGKKAHSDALIKTKDELKAALEAMEKSSAGMAAADADAKKSEARLRAQEKELERMAS